MIPLLIVWLSFVVSASSSASVDSTVNITQCLRHYKVQDLDGRLLRSSSLRSGKMTIPSVCSELICVSRPGHSASVSPLMIYHRSAESSHAYLSLSIDSHSDESRKCLEQVRASPKSYRRSRFPMTMLAAGETHVVFHDSSCPAVRSKQRRLLLLSLLRARSVQPLEAFILCDWQLHVTQPFTLHHRPVSGTNRELSDNSLEPQSQEQSTLNSQQPRGRTSTKSNETITHITLYSGLQARTTPSGFIPQYARFELAPDLVVSVMSSCHGGQQQMEFINRLGATWLGAIDSCLRLLCHSTVEHLAVGHYNYVLYNEQRAEGEACFRALAANNVGTTVSTPLTQVRIISAGEDDTCSGSKVMVLSPAYAGTSQRLQRFLYYQAYKLHSFGCPELAEACLKRKLTGYTYHSSENGALSRSSNPASVGRIKPNSSPFPYHCANLLCDESVNLQQSPVHDTIFRISVDSAKIRPLNNVCFKSLSRSKMARTAGDPSVQVNVPKLGISLLFDLL